MQLTDIFIKRPVLAICFNLAILLLGYQALQSLTVRQYPRSDNAKVIVRTVYIGANADLVRGYITTPLERSIASADGIDFIESSSMQGMSTITAHLKLNFDQNAALTQIQAKVSQVRNELPAEAEAPTITVEQADNQFASMYLSFSSDSLEQNQITDYLTRAVQPRLSSIAGVQRADILGARTFAMRIWLKSDQLAAYNLTPSAVTAALARNNYLATVGATKGNMVQVNLVANTDLTSKEEFENLVVLDRDGALVRLKEVANVVLGAENYDEDVRFGGKTATFMGIWVLPNANSLDVIKAIRAELPFVEAQLPSGMKLGVPYDATEYIQDALTEVFRTLVETILIVVVVIFLFIGSLRGVFVPVVAIPLSLIGVGIVMLVAGFTINLLTLLAIVLAVGLVVDDAIVMLENVERHVQEGMTPVDAAIKGARELVGPTISMTITLAAVYAPIGFQGGLTGALFKEFAFTLAGAVVISGIVALTLSPMMSSRLLVAGHSSNFQRKLGTFFDRLRERYRAILRRNLDRSAPILTAAALTILVLPLLYLFSAQELAPREDQGVVFGIVQAAPNATLDQTSLYTEEVYKAFKSFPEHANTFQLTNAQGGFSGFVTKPWSERSRTTLELEGEAWGKVSSIPGVRVIVVTPAPLPGGSDFQIEFVITSTAEPREIVEYANRLVGAAFASGVFMFADTDLKFDAPQTELVIDHDKIALMGLNLQTVGADLSAMLGGNWVNRFSVQGRSYKVIPQVQRSERLTAEQIQNYYVAGPGEQLVPVSTFTTLRQTVEPRQLNRFQQLNSAKIQGALVPGVSLDQGLTVLENAAQEMLPRDFNIDYAGESRQLRREGSKLVGTLMLAMVLIYLVLAAQFESFRDPFIILTGSVPLGLAGALVFTFLGLTSINIYSQVGLITLVGLVSKNGILIVEFANSLQEQGRRKLDAIIEASATRLRPILMTSVATVVGHFPLILAAGAGAGARNSIGYVLVTGMTIGTLFTLFVVPAIYLLIAKDRSVSHAQDGLTSDFSYSGHSISEQRDSGVGEQRA